MPRGMEAPFLNRYQRGCDRNNRQIWIVAQNRSINCRQKGRSNISFNNLTVVERRLILMVAEILQSGFGWPLYVLSSAAQG